MASFRYRIFVNHVKGRVLVSGKDEDLELLKEGWTLQGEYSSWREAYRMGRAIADKYDYILEWYLEEEEQEKFGTLRHIASMSRLLLSLN